MDDKKLGEILENHSHWLNEDCDDWENTRADLSDADLRGADLSDAKLGGVNFRRADFRGAKNVPFIPFACPDTGAFIGFKKGKHEDACKWLC